MFKASPVTSPIISPFFTMEPSSINLLKDTSPKSVKTLSNTGKPHIIPSSFEIKSALAMLPLETIAEAVISP